MPIELDLQPHVFKWEANNGQRLTHGQLAQRLEVSLATVNRFYSGNLKHINLETLDKLCELFNCQPTDILVRKSS